MSPSPTTCGVGGPPGSSWEEELDSSVPLSVVPKLGVSVAVSTVVTGGVGVAGDVVGNGGGVGVSSSSRSAVE